MFFSSDCNLVSKSNKTIFLKHNVMEGSESSNECAFNDEVPLHVVQFLESDEVMISECKKKIQ